jgi:hypothetical protein
MHTRRLGVLLTELCVGKPAFDARTNISFDAVEIGFTEDSLTSSFTPLEEVLREVEMEVSEDLKEAVRHCLLQRRHRNPLLEIKLRNFMMMSSDRKCLK